MEDIHPPFLLSDLIDFDQLGRILQDFCDIVGIASAIIDLEGEVLVSVRWKRLCTDFHRKDPRSRKRCIESDTFLAADLREGERFSVYTCRNGLTDAASPIIIEGRHVANVFVGQFLLDEPDREFFRKQALEFGFDLDEYMRALEEVPIVSREKLPAILGFLKGFADLIGTVSLNCLRAEAAEKLCKIRAADTETARNKLAEEQENLEKILAERTEKLRQSEEDSRLILESAAEGIFGTDEQGLCTFANEAARKILGYTSEEIIGYPVHERFHHSNADGTPHAKEECPIVMAYRMGKTSFRRDEVFWRKDNTCIDVSYTSVPKKKGEKIVGSVVVFRDITARKRAEDALQDSEYRLQTILSTSREGFWWINNQAVTVAVNEAMCQILGRPQEKILGKRVFDFLNAENLVIMEDQLRRRATGETGTYEIEISRPDGTQVPCLFHATPLYDKKGIKTGSFAMVTNIADRKKMEMDLIEARDRAESATRAKGNFLANMSHEIRTPMNAVLGMTHLALKTDLTPKQMDYLNKIQLSANSLLGVINDILDFSKIEAGKLSMESITFNLDEVLENLATLMTVKAQEAEGIEVLFNTDPNVPRSLVGDPLRLSQVLINLANNALKFTRRGEIVVSTELIRLEPHRAEIQFSVRDTGIGMTSEQMAMLFTPFSQADTSITRKYGGTGLGLTISQRLVEMMEGRIWVDSISGAGSTFYFTGIFGIGKTEGMTCHLPPPDLRGIRALVVDDNPTSREIFQKMLESFTFEVTLAASGEEGLQEIERSVGGKPFDIVIMDWKMPGLDGIETARRIRRDKRLPRIPVMILVSAYGREEIMWRSEAAGLDAFLIKPISPSVMFDTIMHILANHVAGDFAHGGKPGQEPNVRKGLEGVRILVVEDNEINQQVAQEILADAGMIVSVAENGQEALDLLQTHSYDALLMDIQMPVMDGYTATRRIRQDLRFQELPIIAMTAHAMAGDQEKSVAAGMNDHITKPIDPSQLYLVLSKWISSATGNRAEKEQPKSDPAVGLESEIAVIGKPISEEDALLPPVLDGFDLEGGLRRLRGNRSLYRRLLQDFSSRCDRATDEIRVALGKRDYSSAHHLVHDIKGLAGNLSASDLQKAAGVLDRIIQHGKEGEPVFSNELDKAFAVFETQMKRAAESTRQLQSAEGDQPAIMESVIPGLPPDLAQEAATRLREAAETGDIAAITTIVGEMHSRCPVFAPVAESVVRMTENFDFDGIHRLADELEGLPRSDRSVRKP